MTNAELIKALRHCANDLPCETESYRCKYAEIWECNVQLRVDAADALEELQQIADHHEQTAKDYWKEACEYKQRIAELEAQMPKEGEWIDLFGHDYKCSVCGEWYRMDGTPEQEDMNYCPNCGAKMRGEHE